MTDNEHVKPGALVHFLTSVTIPTNDDFGAVVARGATITLDAQLIAAGIDRNGASWLDVLGDDEAQLARWDEIRYRPGPWPSGEPVLVSGSAEWADAREAARKAAWTVTDPQERYDARAKVESDFGPAPSTVKTLSESRR